MGRKPGKRLITLLLALLIAIEPVVVPVLAADGLPKPSINTKEVNGLVNLEKVIAPADYLEQIMRLRGKTRDEAEARAWGEWMSMLNSSYMLLDDGSSDVFGFYEAMKMLRENSTVLSDVAEVSRAIIGFTLHGFSYIVRSRLLARSANLVVGFMRLNNLANMADTTMATVQGSKFLDVMEFTAPPPCWNNPEVAGQGFKSYWRWVQKKAGNTSVPDELTDGQGIARSVGIGLVIVGLAIDAWGIYRSEDREVGRTSYSLAKHYVGAFFGLASLVALCCTPFIGQAILLAGLTWSIIVFVGDVLGEYNKRWKDAYKNSYWYLYENDPEFRSFYDNRALLKSEEKAVSLQMVHNRFQEFKVAEARTGDSPEARNGRVFIALEKQGVLMSYYSQKGFSLPDFDSDRLKELWQMKADYMSWKPTEKEARDKSFWGKVGRALSPVTWAGWAGDGIQSKDYRKTIEQYNIQKVFFNPDYVLIKKYLNYTTANKLTGGIYDAVGLRIEQSPFNYAPLIGVEAGMFNEELLRESLAADAFQIGQKELAYLREQIKGAAAQTEEFITGMDKTIAKIDEKDLPQAARLRKFFDRLAKACTAEPDKADSKIFTDGRRLFAWRWNSDKKEKTAAAIVKAFKKDIEKSLLYEPLSLAQKAAETVVLLTTVKQQLDLSALMRAYLKDRKEALQKFDDTFRTIAINDFLKTGSFLDVKGGTVSDWFGQVYSTHEETQKLLKLLEKDVENFTGFADNANADSRDRLLWFDKEITHPAELLKKINDELAAWKETLAAWSTLTEKTGIKLPLADNEAFADKVFREFKLDYELEPLNPDNPLAEMAAPEK
ncbi:MAG TPA: hypothetical protein PLM07_13050 [Candidatus Rifleibacterium sp.]|nr:hypothetical protein [Candidatus Rifleibacterium sp.]HPT46812.1 hypothetical protein [Candidatus Rifleibacterium sp.]